LKIPFRLPLALAALLAIHAPAARAGTTPIPRETVAVPADARSLMRVNSTIQPYDFIRPWSKKAPFTRRGLGVVIPGGTLLVTAELVGNQTYVELEKPASAQKCPASVEAVDYDCNLALVKPSDPHFLDGAVPLELDAKARVGDRVEVLQLEANGAIATTPGSITSVFVGPYPIEEIALLNFRLSVPMQHRDGSFTLPAVRSGKLVGLLMRYDARSQTADIIPPPVIRAFLDGAGQNGQGGVPRTGLAFVPARDPQLRRFVGIGEREDGVYVTEVLPGGPAEAAGIRKGDVILKVGGEAIDADGNYADPLYGRIPFSFLLSTRARPGQQIPLVVWRDGAEIPLSVTVQPRDRSKMVSESYIIDRAPRYLILGGLVFQELSRPYLQEWGNDWRKQAPQRLVYRDAYQSQLPADQGKIVFLSQVLPSRDTLGYESLGGQIVKSINGVAIHNLDDVKRAVAQPENGFHRVEFEEDPSLIFLDAAAVEAGRDQLMRDYGLPALENLDGR